jgi:hypothetical protein
VTTPPDGAPERIGRMLGRAVARGRAAARRAREPESQAQIAAAARAAADVAKRRLGEHGPDMAEAAAHHAVDRALIALRLRSGFLGVVLDPLLGEARTAAVHHARRLAARPPAEAPGKDEPKS